MPNYACTEGKGGGKVHRTQSSLHVTQVLWLNGDKIQNNSSVKVANILKHPAGVLTTEAHSPGSCEMGGCLPTVATRRAASHEVGPKTSPRFN